MKTVFFLIAITVLLTGCNQPDDSKVIALEKRVAALERIASQNTNPVAVVSTAPPITNTNLNYNDVVQIKLWTSHKMEDMAIEEIRKRYELQTNLMDYVDKVFNISIGIKK